MTEPGTMQPWDIVTAYGQCLGVWVARSAEGAVLEWASLPLARYIVMERVFDLLVRQDGRDWPWQRIRVEWPARRLL